jgi:hypothetical protein
MQIANIQIGNMQIVRNGLNRKIVRNRNLLEIELELENANS